MNPFQPYIAPHYTRLKTREVAIGHLPLGGKNPIRIQSMVNTPTLDTEATIAQCIRLADAGCEYIRITAQGPREAEHLRVIKAELRKRGYANPLIADIHYSPRAAEIAAALVEKVRINPGNYTDRKRGKAHFSSREYHEETERIRERLMPLVKICKQHGTAMRIGSNHGSLSERILSAWGDTPRGMVEAALEFIRICEDLDYHSLVVSMKASNPRVMIEANRLLVQGMAEAGILYPVHLGVTEAGAGEDGRIKSAAGIGPLLAEGIGDTLRVSLTEAPEAEIPVARQLIQMTGGYATAAPLPRLCPEILHPGDLPSPPARNGLLPDTKHPLVIGRSTLGDLHPERITSAGTEWDAAFVAEPHFESLADGRPVILSSSHPREWASLRNVLAWLRVHRPGNPVILKREGEGEDPETFVVHSAAILSPLLQEGFGNALWLNHPQTDGDTLAGISLRILQAAGRRISQAAFVSCPSCGRTQYNIEESLKKIREKTAHLAGLTIGVMGCIVNGPGEMAGADYGYVGAGKGKVTLYKGKEPVKKEIPEASAVEELIRLIQENGDWHEPKS